MYALGGLKLRGQRRFKQRADRADEASEEI